MGVQILIHGCSFKLDFEVHSKKISENQLIRLLNKNETVNLKVLKLIMKN